MVYYFAISVFVPSSMFCHKQYIRGQGYVYGTAGKNVRLAVLALVQYYNNYDVIMIKSRAQR